MKLILGQKTINRIQANGGGKAVGHIGWLLSYVSGLALLLIIIGMSTVSAAEAERVALDGPAFAFDGEDIKAESLTCNGLIACMWLAAATNDCEGGGWSTNPDGSVTCT